MILVTGGAGFIGSNFVETWLAERNEAVLTVDKLTYASSLDNLAAVHNDPRHTFVRADIADPVAMKDLLSAHRPRAIIHFAAESHVDRSISGPSSFVQTNVFGTYTLLEATRTHLECLNDSEREAFRYIQISTDEVFGSLSENAPSFSEASPYRPNNPYAASKAAGDHFARAWHNTFGLPVVTIHSCNNFGPRQHIEKLIPRMIGCALRGDALPIYGNGLQKREWLYVKDNCAAIRAVLDGGIVGQSYAVGGTKEVTNLELVKLLCVELDALAPCGKGYTEQIAFVADRPGHDRRYALDDTRIRCELGWRPSTSFNEGLRKTVAWYLANLHALEA